MILRIRHKVFLVLVVMSFFATQTESTAAPKLKFKQIEARADKAFIRGDYKTAMKLYGQADDKTPSESVHKSRLELKIARLYTLLQQPEMAVKYYGAVRSSADTLLTVNDVCFYVDALRQNGDQQAAEVVARSYCFKSPYNRNQRYMNTLYSLSNQQYYYAKGSSDFAVNLFEKSSSLPEYWIGSWQGESFYAVSNSPIQDPLKVYYHRTQYFSLHDKEILHPFNSIPRELQSGPAAFRDDNKVMVATGISYRNKERIVNPGEEDNFFVSQLYYSIIISQGGRWSHPMPLFENQENYNYAHPVFFNKGNSLIFSSDMPGTHGGMDLFVSHWDEANNKWGKPINLGPTVNTEGNEIFPFILNDALFFSSNGLQGYGGYDIYRAQFSRNIVMPGTLFHYPYPINSTHNDFQIFFDTQAGYFISDRRGRNGGDDIYTFDRSISSLNSSTAIGVSDEYMAMTGNLNLIKGLGSNTTNVTEKELVITPMINIPQEGELLLSIYFDYDSYKINGESLSKLEALITDKGVKELKELYVIGYADEFGTTGYNKKLSENRATAVGNILINGKISPALQIEGRGQLVLTQAQNDKAAKNPKFNLGELQVGRNYAPTKEQIQITQKARRVDIIVKKK